MMPKIDSHCHRPRYLHENVEIAQPFLHTGKLPPIETTVRSGRADYLSFCRKRDRGKMQLMPSSKHHVTASYEADGSLMRIGFVIIFFFKLCPDLDETIFEEQE
jgi:hypothetical protein